MSAFPYINMIKSVRFRLITDSTGRVLGRKASGNPLYLEKERVSGE